MIIHWIMRFSFNATLELLWSKLALLVKSCKREERKVPIIEK